jgi:hypothetical protein
MNNDYRQGYRDGFEDGMKSKVTADKVQSNICSICNRDFRATATQVFFCPVVGCNHPQSVSVSRANISAVVLL